MSELAGVEFTGERVIPDQVEADLLNEHVARYRFANRIAAGMGRAPRVLDAGCGSGYGTAELSNAASIAAADISAAAIAYSRRHYGRRERPCVDFVRAACEAMPFADAAFDLVVAFEVIEHMERWRDLVSEANRVLRPTGILLVSTPNRDYYAESRGAAGPNPFHVHEFDCDEFRQSLGAVFPHVHIWTQNHAGAIVFSPQGVRQGEAKLDATVTGDAAAAHFFLAACSQSPVSAASEIFAWLPSSANVLRERERHIAKLDEELKKKDAWLRQSTETHADLQKKHEALTAELQAQNCWAAGLNREVALCNTRIADLQDEQAARLMWIAGLESQLARAAAEIERLRAESAGLTKTAQLEIERLRAESAGLTKTAQLEIERLNALLTERSLWAQRLDTEIGECREQHREELRRIASSIWVRVGAKLGFGPRVRDGQ